MGAAVGLGVVVEGGMWRVGKIVLCGGGLLWGKLLIVRLLPRIVRLWGDGG